MRFDLKTHWQCVATEYESHTLLTKPILKVAATDGFHLGY